MESNNHRHAVAQPTYLKMWFNFENIKRPLTSVPTPFQKPYLPSSLYLHIVNASEKSFDARLRKRKRNEKKIVKHLHSTLSCVRWRALGKYPIRSYTISGVQFRCTLAFYDALNCDDETAFVALFSSQPRRDYGKKLYRT